MFYEKAWGVKYSKIKNINHQKSIFKYIDKSGENIYSLKKDPKYLIDGVVYGNFGMNGFLIINYLLLKQLLDI